MLEAGGEDRGRSKSSTHMEFCAVWASAHGSTATVPTPALGNHQKCPLFPAHASSTLKLRFRYWLQQQIPGPDGPWWRKFCPEGPAASLVCCVQGDGISLGNGRRIPSHGGDPVLCSDWVGLSCKLVSHSCTGFLPWSGPCLGSELSSFLSLALGHSEGFGGLEVGQCLVAGGG